MTTRAAAAVAFDPGPLSDIGDPDTEAELISMFLAQAAERLPELRQAIGAGDVDRLHKLAHGLQGSSATVGASRMSQLCEALSLIEAGAIPSQAGAIHLELVSSVKATSAAMAAHVEWAATRD